MSKASYWAKINEARPKLRVEGVSLDLTIDGDLCFNSWSQYRLSPAAALTVAAWLVDTFGEDSKEPNSKAE